MNPERTAKSALTPTTGSGESNHLLLLQTGQPREELEESLSGVAQLDARSVQLDNKNAKRTRWDSLSMPKINQEDNESLRCSVRANDQEGGMCFASEQTDIEVKQINSTLGSSNRCRVESDECPARRLVNSQPVWREENMLSHELAKRWELIRSYERFIVDVVVKADLMYRCDDFEYFLGNAMRTHEDLKLEYGEQFKYYPIESLTVFSSQPTIADMENVTNTIPPPALYEFQEYPQKKRLLSQKKGANSASKSPSKKSPKKTSQIKLTNGSETQRAAVAAQQLSQSSVSEIQRGLKLLSKGNTFQKWCVHRHKVESVHVSFSTDLKYFAWRTSGKKPELIPLTQFKELKVGKVTSNFQRYLKPNEDPHDDRSFSLVFSSRTVDLTATSTQECASFVQAIAALMKYFPQAPL